MTRAARPVLWTNETLRRDLGLPDSAAHSGRPLAIERVEIELGACGPGSLFVPFKQPPVHQPAVIMRGLAAGAVAALTTADLTAFPVGTPVLKVADLRAAIRTLRDIARSRFAGELVAITGSVGKTTTKDMLAHVLGHFGATHATAGNYNEHFGVMKTIASIPAEASYAVVEVSSSLPGSVKVKAPYVKPTVAIVSNVGFSHGQNFRSRYEILRDKVSLMDALLGRKLAIVGRSVLEFDRENERLIDTKPKDLLLTVGESIDDFARLLQFEIAATSTTATAEVNGELIRYALPAAGRHFAENALFALTVAASLGLDVKQAADTLATFAPPKRRGERFRVPIGTAGEALELIDDAYNASPDSVRVLLGALQARSPRRKVLVLGDMAALGPEAPRMHEDLAPDVEAAKVDLLIAVGPMMGALGRKLENSLETRYYAGAADLKPDLLNIVRAGDLVALKASNAANFIQLVRALVPNPARAQRPRGNWTIETEVPGRQRQRRA